MLIPIGALVTTISPAQRQRKDFGYGLVVSRNREWRKEEELELMFDDGTFEWYPTWMLQVVK